MGLLVKTATILLILIIVAVIYGDNIKNVWQEAKGKVDDLKTEAYYKINPSARKTLLIDELSNNLSEISELLTGDGIESSSNLDDSEIKDINKAINAINNSKDLLSEIEIIEENPGLLNKGIGVLTNLITSTNQQCVVPTPTQTPSGN